MVHLLLDEGADPNIADRYGETPLLLAAEEGHQNVVQLLIANGADANMTDLEGNAPQSVAEQMGNMVIAIILRDHNRKIKSMKINLCTQVGK